MFVYRSDNVNKNSGIILIEFMLAMTLGLLLLHFLLAIYLASQQSYRLQIALNQIQDNAKTAIHLLKADIREAGYIGCARLDHDFMITPYSSYSLTRQNRLMGTHSEITIRHAASSDAMLIQPMNSADTLYVSKDVHFSSGDILFISDCKQAEIFQAKEVVFLRKAQKIVSVQALKNQYEHYAEVSKLQLNKYFIAKTKRKNADGSPIYSLFIQDIHQQQTELVENIEYMKITYSLEQEGELLDKTANEIHDWSDVKGVMIDLKLTASPIKKIWHMVVSLNADQSR